VATGAAGEGADPALAAAPDGTLSLLAMTVSTGAGELVGFTKGPGEPWGAPQTPDSADVGRLPELSVVSDATESEAHAV